METLAKSENRTQVPQLEQYVYTSSPKGLGPHALGYRVRAWSPGLDPKLVGSGRLDALDAFRSYGLPADAHLDDPEIENHAPISLSYDRLSSNKSAKQFNPHELETRILGHNVYNRESASGRLGGETAHVIAGLPETFTAVDAMSLFASSFWIRQDDPKYGTELRRQTVEELLDRARYTHYTPEPIPEDVLKQVVNSLGTQDPRFPIYIFGPSKEVAATIAQTAASLPDRGRDLTFTTHLSKHQINQSFSGDFRRLPRIVGSSWMGNDRDALLREAHAFQSELEYKKAGAVINLYERAA